MWYSQITDNLNALSLYEQKYNAEQFEMEMTAKGWTLKAICGALGNISIEGQLNPGQCENGWGVPSSPTDVYYPGGLGLIGWTEYLRDTQPGVYPNAMILYAMNEGGDWWDPLLQCKLINEADNNSVQQYWSWLPDGPWTSVTSMAQYKQWTGSVADAAACFCWNCEKPGDIEATIPDRQAWAEYWYEYFTHTPVPPPLSNLMKKVLMMIPASSKKHIWWRW